MNAWPLLAQYLIVRTAKTNHIGIITHVQDIYPESLINKLLVFRTFFQHFLLPIDKYILNNSDKVIAISEQMKIHLMNTRKIGENNICVVPNWLNGEIFKNHALENKSIQNETSHPFTFMYLGNIGPIAGVDLLIESFIKANLADCRLVIAGSGSQKENLQRKVSKLNIKTIEFWSVPDGKVPEIQSQADIMLLPVIKGASLSSVPSKLLAYMYSSKPVLACADRDSDTAKTINDSSCGWVIGPEDKDLLSKYMTLTLSLDYAQLKIKGDNGFEYANKYFSHQKNLGYICEIIEAT